MRKVTDKHKKCRKKQIKWKKIKISTRTWKPYQDITIYIKNISWYLRYGSSHGGAATPRPSLTVFLTAKPGNEAASPPKPHPHHTSKSAYMTKKFLSVTFREFTYAIQSVTDTKQLMNLVDPGINFCIVSVKSWITAQVTMNTQISPVSPKNTTLRAYSWCVVVSGKMPQRSWILNKMIDYCQTSI